MKSESEFKDFSLVFHIAGCDQPHRYEVSEAEFHRARDVLQTPKAQPSETPRFFCFETLTGLWVAVSLKDVELIHYLWDPVKHRLTDPDDDYDEQLPDALKLHFRGNPEPFECGVDTPDELFALTILLDGDFEGDDPFLVFPDGSGEDVAVNVTYLVLAEARLDEVNEGQRMSNAAAE